MMTSRISFKDIFDNSNQEGKRVRWVGHIARMGRMNDVYKIQKT